jgi:hypothetical protein
MSRSARTSRGCAAWTGAERSIRVRAAPWGYAVLITRTDPPVYRFSSRFFVVFLAFMVWAFWPSYFARLFEQPSFWFHAHGIALTLWCALLVVQAQLIRTGRRTWHRWLGRSSYVLAPAVVLVTLLFVHYRVANGLRGVAVLPAFGLHFLALTLIALVVFASFYGLAIGFRKNPQVHARWMACTVFPLFTPVTDRLIGAHFRPLIGLVPQIDGNPVLPAAGFLLADVLLAVLAAWDWRANRRLTVFPLALGALLVYHAGALTLHRLTLWNAFCVWFIGLPLP